MVLTEEQSINIYPAATLEGTYNATGTPQQNSMVNYEKGFYNIDNTKILAESSIPSWVAPPESAANTKLYYNNNGNPPSNTSYPANCIPAQTAGSGNVYKLNPATGGKTTGLEFMIKVMAGDHIDIFGKSYYLNTATVSNSNSTTLNVLSLFTNLLLAPSNALSGKGVTATQLNTLNSNLMPSAFFRGSNNETPTTVPKAYINYIFLDEQFKYAGAGNFSRVGISGTVKDHWYTDAVQLQNISVPKNGYIFVYVSNESNLDVFFDNLQVIHKPGPILEETHYYPFGLTMAGISSKAAGGLINRKKFNDATELQSVEFSDGSGLELYATNFRSLDPQIGRFCQIDPLAMASVSLSLYQYANNNPILINDPLGLIGDTVWKKLPVVTVTAIKVNKVILIPEVHNTFFGTYTTYRYPEAIQKAARADAGNFLARWTPLGKAIYALNSLLDILDKNIVFASKSVDDLKKEGSLEGTTGNGTEIITKEGGMEQADRDFNDVTVSGSSKSNPNIPGGRIGKTPNGKTVNVRNTSSDGRPTLEVYNSKTRTTEVKIRYE